MIEHILIPPWAFGASDLHAFVKAMRLEERSRADQMPSGPIAQLQCHSNAHWEIRDVPSTSALCQPMQSDTVEPEG